MPVTTALAATVVTVICAPPIVVLVLEGVHGAGAGGVGAVRMVELLGNTLLLVAIVVIGTTVAGTATALLTVRSAIPFRRVWSGLVMVPLVLPAYVLALSLTGMAGGDGVVTGWLAPFGVERLPVPSGLWAAAACLVLSCLPIVHALVGSALRRADPALEESARLLGDSPARVFARVLLPQLRTAIATGGCLAALYALSDFGAVSILRYDTFTRAVFAQFRGRVDLAPAFALCAVLVAIAAVFIVAHAVLRGRADAASTRVRRVTTVLLGPAGTIAGTLLLSLIVACSLVLPVATLATWAVRGLARSVQPGPVFAEALATLGLASTAGVLVLVLAVPVAVALHFGGGRLARFAEGLAWATHSLPHLAVGLAFLVVSLALPTIFYQSTGTLLIAYAALFLPLATGALVIAFRQVDPRLLDISRSLGNGATRTGWRIVVPLVWRGAATGALLVAFGVLHELPATILLRPTGMETLAIRVWGSVSEGQYTTGSIAALLLVLVSVPFVVVHHRLTLEREASR